MLVFRILGMLAVAGMIGGCLLYMITGNRKYLGFTLQLAKYTVILALAEFALLLVERLTGAL